MVTDLKTREKKKLIDSLLERDHVLVHIAPHAPDVSLPLHLMNNHTVTLKLSRHFRGAIELHADHIESHLLFGQKYFQCLIPYDAIWGVTSEDGETTSWLAGFVETASPSAATAASVAASEEKDSQDSDGDKEYIRPVLSLTKEKPEETDSSEKMDEPEEKSENSEGEAPKGRPKLVRIK